MKSKGVEVQHCGGLAGGGPNERGFLRTQIQLSAHCWCWSLMAAISCRMASWEASNSLANFES